MLEKYKIYIDHHWIAPSFPQWTDEFLRFHGHDPWYLPPDNGHPVLDQILYQSRHKEKILLIIAMESLKTFLDRPSPFNDFASLINAGKIDLVIHNRMDTNFMLSFYHHGIRDRVKLVKQCDFLRGVKSKVLCDGVLDDEVKKSFPNTEFYDGFDYQLLAGYGFFPEIYSGMDHGQERQRTFFTCFLEDETRPHRRFLAKGIRRSKFVGDPIIRINPWQIKREKVHASDIDQCGYDPTWLKSKTLPKENFPNINFYQHTNLELVVEGLGFDRETTFDPSEKIFKCIYMNHPFIVLSNRNFLHHLRNMGFWTFDGLIDEAYDKMDMASDRVDAVLEILKDMDTERAKRFYHDSREIRDHNRNHLFSLIGRYKTDLWVNFRRLFSDLE